MALAQQSWDRAYRISPRQFNPYALGIHNQPRWKQQVRQDGLLNLWRTRGFPDQCRPLIPGFDDPDSLKPGKRDCAPAAKRGLRFIDR